MAQQAMYQQMVFPTRFVWAYGGKQVRALPTAPPIDERVLTHPPRVTFARRPRRRAVRARLISAAPPHAPVSPLPALPLPQVHLCGSFTNWLETVPMAPEPTPNGVQVFAVVCNLPPGYHQYKFIVDGEWRHDENQAFIQDPLGNVNNWYAIPAILGPRRARARAASPPPARRRAAPRPAPRGSTKTLHPAPGWASEGVVFFPRPSSAERSRRASSPHLDRGSLTPSLSSPRAPLASPPARHSGCS